MSNVVVVRAAWVIKLKRGPMSMIAVLQSCHRQCVLA